MRIWRQCWSGLLGAGRGAVPVPAGGYRFPLVQAPASREGLIEPVTVERLTDLGYQLSFSAAEHRPRGQAAPLTQALGRAGQPRRPLRVTFGQLQLGVGA